MGGQAGRVRRCERARAAGFRTFGNFDDDIGIARVRRDRTPHAVVGRGYFVLIVTHGRRRRSRSCTLEKTHFGRSFTKDYVTFVVIIKCTASDRHSYNARTCLSNTFRNRKTITKMSFATFVLLT